MKTAGRRAHNVEVSSRHRAVGQRPQGRILLNIVLGIIAVLWMIPLLGILITSFRTRAAVDSTGWWTVFTDWGSAGWSAASYAQAFQALKLPGAS